MDKDNLIKLRDFIITGEKSLKNAKKILKDILKENNIKLTGMKLDTEGLSSYVSEDSKIVEGVFTGEEMLGSDGNKYPVSANYASKSKLVQGDKLKLTIEHSGKMIYKQIQPIERETKVGLLISDKDKFQVILEGKNYNLLRAAVTHFKGTPGDNISVILPKGKQATFAAIEAVIPKE